MKKVICVILFTALYSCNNPGDPKKEAVFVEAVEAPVLNLEQADRLAQLPIHCMETEYPNKLGQTIGSADDLGTPKELHPAFYGCFDWHSAVHGHWSLVSLLKEFPDLKGRDSIKQKLLSTISKDHVLKEVEYFHGEHNASYERTYGWAWLLKLAEELHKWDDPFAKKLEENLQPLTDLIVEKYMVFLPKLNYPIRVGTHTNTAFGLSFAWDYAIALNNEELKAIIEQRAREFYYTDKDCPLKWEPSGYDFLSPCLEEAGLMKRILPNHEFLVWLNKFLPQLKDKDFDLKVGEVSDRTDGHLVHLDGVNFSRAWNFNIIAEGMPEYKHLKALANKHVKYSLPSIVDGNYEGGHWLATFAIFALNTSGR